MVSPVRIRVPPLLKVLQNTRKRKALEDRFEGFGSNAAATRFGVVAIKRP
jgi:hypothetical protein